MTVTTIGVTQCAGSGVAVPDLAASTVFWPEIAAAVAIFSGVGVLVMMIQAAVVRGHNAGPASAGLVEVGDEVGFTGLGVGV